MLIREKTQRYNPVTGKPYLTWADKSTLCDCCGKEFVNPAYPDEEGEDFQTEAPLYFQIQDPSESEPFFSEYRSKKYPKLDIYSVFNNDEGRFLLCSSCDEKITLYMSNNKEKRLSTFLFKSRLRLVEKLIAEGKDLKELNLQ